MDVGLRAALIAVVFLVGCGPIPRELKVDAAARGERYRLLATQAAPPAWKAGSKWAFTANDAKGHLERSVVFRITDEPAQTCISGQWKRLEVVSEDAPFTRHPAYSLEGRNLSILLTNELCDAYYEFNGELDERGFSGRHETSFPGGGRTYGSVIGEPVHD